MRENERGLARNDASAVRMAADVPNAAAANQPCPENSSVRPLDILSTTKIAAMPTVMRRLPRCVSGSSG